MNGYIRRLIKCGFPVEKAISVYKDFMKNFSIAELEVYVRYIEETSNVGTLQS